MFYTINGVAQDAIMIIVAIDPGIKNLGWSVYDTNQCRFKSFGRYNLLKDQPKAMHTKYPQLVHGFITASKAVFDVADIVVIEIQMVAKFKIIQTAFQCFFWGKSHLISPRSVRCHFDISTGNYAKNKKASVAAIPKLDIPKQNKTWFNTLEVGKRDDVADAILLGLYWVEKGAEKESKKRKRK
tara:strand:+ start:4015 stop:4566 length:552 start_codon:yes stop_codon:yes gene_type:complete